MRRLDFTILPPIGSGMIHASGSIADLLRHIPSLLDSGLIPPLSVINSVLVTGISDAAMSGGCSWTPFSLDRAEYADVVSELIAQGDREGNPLRDGEAPVWVESNMDWFIWVCFKRNGIPLDEHRALQQELEQVEMARKQATAADDYDRVEQLQSREDEITAAITQLILKHRTS